MAGKEFYRWLPMMLAFGLASALLAGCGTGSESVRLMDAALTVEEVRLGTVARVESAAVVLASDQHVFRFDGASARTFTKCEAAICGVSSTSAGLEGTLERARSDPGADPVLGEHPS